MNRVPLARRVQIINCLVEGNSIRSTERMTGTHRDTICRLLVEVGDGCAKLMGEQMRELPCRRIEVDEIWAYVGKKQRHMTALDDPRRVGDRTRRALHHHPAPNDRAEDDRKGLLARVAAREIGQHGARHAHAANARAGPATTPAAAAARNSGACSWLGTRLRST